MSYGGTLRPPLMPSPPPPSQGECVVHAGNFQPSPVIAKSGGQLLCVTCDGRHQKQRSPWSPRGDCSPDSPACFNQAAPTPPHSAGAWAHLLRSALQPRPHRQNLAPGLHHRSGSADSDDSTSPYATHSAATVSVGRELALSAGKDSRGSKRLVLLLGSQGQG